MWEGKQSYKRKYDKVVISDDVRYICVRITEHKCPLNERITTRENQGVTLTLENCYSNHGAINNIFHSKKTSSVGCDLLMI